MEPAPYEVGRPPSVWGPAARQLADLGARRRLWEASPSARHYDAEHEALRRQYEELRRQYEELRRQYEAIKAWVGQAPPDGTPKSPKPKGRNRLGPRG